MIKEIFILIFLYQHSNAGIGVVASGTLKTQDEDTDEFSNSTEKAQDVVSSSGIIKGVLVDEFTAACQQILKGDLIADGNICIPGVSKDLMQWWPSNRTDKRPEIWISISNFQVIEIGTQTLTLSMYMDISWFDNRPIRCNFW